MIRALSIVLVLSLAGASPALAQKRGRAASLADLHARIAPSIVTITSEGRSGTGTGAGVLLHRDGFVATAAHVVEDGMRISVEFTDGSRAPAEIATLSRTEDLALLKVESVPKAARVAKLGDSSKTRVGDDALCIGAPLGLKNTLTTGIVSALRDDYGTEFNFLPKHVIQTDAAINQGNSGGAVFNRRGEVIGISSFIAHRGGGSIGLGFAVPSNVVRARLFENALPYLGVSLRKVPNKLAKVLNWPVEDALLVEKVRPGSAADHAGLASGSIPTDIGGVKLLLGGDLIIKVGPHTPHEAKKVHAYLHSLKKGDTIPYTIVRGGKPRLVEVKVERLIAPPKLK
jgi:S1-C subfamily serine protease